MLSLDGRVPNDHLVRPIEPVAEFFFCDLFTGLYRPDNGRPWKLVIAGDFVDFAGATHRHAFKRFGARLGIGGGTDRTTDPAERMHPPSG